MPQKVVVTGGAGFIGSHLTDALKSAGHSVTVVDNLCSGGKPCVQSADELIVDDIRNFRVVKKAFEGATTVFHLAALPRVLRSVKFPMGTHNVNATGTLTVLQAARSANVKRVIFSSSSSVYGNPAVLPAHEGLMPMPLSPYATQKLIGEHYCRNFFDLYGLETVCLRFFNVYGPRFDPNGPYALVIGKFINQRLRGEPLTICGDGEQTRDFTHVSDIVRACILASKVPLYGQTLICNTGGGNPASINHIAELVGGPTITEPARTGEPRKTHADISKAKAILEWTPLVRIEQGITELKKSCGLP